MSKVVHALVTGASAGLGREMVRQLVREHGMTVMATARRRERLDQLAAELPQGKVIPVAGDLSNPEFRADLWQQAESLPGGLDLLINNAGVGHYAEFADQDSATIRQIIELNVMALFDLTQRAARSMRARGRGQILQVSSVLGSVGIPYSAAYTASKHAVNGLVKCLRYELRGTGVRVWAACPSRTESEFSSVALGQGGKPTNLPRGESTERVVRAILRGLHGNQAFLAPSWTAWAGLKLAAWLPFLYDELIVRWSRRHVAEALRSKSTVESPEAARPSSA